MKKLVSIAKQSLAPALVFAAIILLWELAVYAFSLPKILLPSPTVVMNAAWEQRVALGRGMFVTGSAALVALVCCGLVGLLVAVAFSQSAWIRRAFFPYVVFLQTVPIVAIAPLLIIWSGSNFRTIMLVAMIIGLFPVVSNTTNALLVVPKPILEMFRVNNASVWQVLCKLRLPFAIPAWSLGLRISSGLVVIGAIVGEFFVGNSGNYDGLGTLITHWQARQFTAGLIAAVAATTVLGLFFFGLTKFLSNVLLRRWTRGRL